MVNRDRPGSRAPVERVNLDDDRLRVKGGAVNVAERVGVV